MNGKKKAIASSVAAHASVCDRQFGTARANSGSRHAPKDQKHCEKIPSTPRQDAPTTSQSSVNATTPTPPIVKPACTAHQMHLDASRAYITSTSHINDKQGWQDWSTGTMMS